MINILKSNFGTSAIQLTFTTKTFNIFWTWNLKISSHTNLAGEFREKSDLVSFDEFGKVISDGTFEVGASLVELTPQIKNKQKTTENQHFY